MAGLSKITLVGNLLNEPQSSQTNSGIPLVRFQVGVEREARGQGTPETVMDIYSVVAFGQGSADLDQRFRSGDIGIGTRLLVMGRLEQREGQDGQLQQSTLEITADDVFNLGPDSDLVVRSILGNNAPCRVVVVGNMGGDPEVKQIPSGAKVASFSIAVSRPVSRQAPQREENTNWYRISGWSNIADRMEKLANMGALAKGRKVLIEGTFTPREWQDNSGQRRVSLDVNVRDFELLQGSGDSQFGSDSFGDRRGGDSRGGGSFNDDAGGRGNSGYGGGNLGSGRQDENFGAGGGGRQQDNSGLQDVDDIPF